MWRYVAVTRIRVLSEVAHDTEFRSVVMLCVDLQRCKIAAAAVVVRTV